MIQTSLYIVAALVLGLGLLVLRSGPGSRTNQSFGAFVLLSAIGVLGVAFFHSGTNLRFWAPLAFAATGLLPATFLAFAKYFPTPNPWPTRRVLFVASAVGLLLAVISLTTRWIVRDAVLTPSGPTREAGPLYPLFTIYFLVAWCTALGVHEAFIENFGPTVTHQIDRMERLLDRLRTLARPGERPQHPIDLRAPIGAAIEAMRPAFVEKSVVLSAATGQAPCLILGDYSELEQLFVNLLLNAHEATPSGSMARVEVA